jgi:hypothetical protein
MTPRIVLALVVATAALPASSAAETPPPTEIIPEAVSTDSPSLYVTMGFGPGPGSTTTLERDAPAFVLTFGGSIPIKGKAYVDLSMVLSLASYDARPSVTTWNENLLLETFAFTASARAGHEGRKVAVFGSAGVGFAYVRLGAPYFYGTYSEPVGSTTVPVLTVAASLEAPARQHSRFLTELRYSWIEADLGGGFGGSVNVGGPVLLFGWKYVF